MLAELRRLYSNLCCLKLSVKPSAGDQDAESTGDRNLLTLQRLTHIPCKHTFWRFHPWTVTNGRLPPVQLVILNHNLHPWRKPEFVWCVWWDVCFIISYIWKQFATKLLIMKTENHATWFIFIYKITSKTSMSMYICDSNRSQSQFNKKNWWEKW